MLWLLLDNSAKCQTFSIDTVSFLNDEEQIVKPATEKSTLPIQVQSDKDIPSKKETKKHAPNTHERSVKDAGAKAKERSAHEKSMDTNTSENQTISNSTSAASAIDESESDEPELDENAGKEMLFVPSSVMYNNKWDTLNIRIGRTDWSKIPDTTLLVYNDISENNFVFPFKGKLISRYGRRDGRFHAGMDIKLNRGDTVVSAFDGKVRIARTISGYGKLIVVRHDNGLETVYGHLSHYLVKVNDIVKAGEPIGLGGRTGRASTDHLHFETRILGEHFDPSKIIDFDSFCLKSNCLAMDKDNLGFGTKESPIVAASGNSDNSRYVKIKSGDTLYALALKHKTTVDRICKLNGISRKKVLKIGSRLRIE